MREPGSKSTLYAAVILTAACAGCDGDPILKCPPADPPMTAQYIDATNIVIEVTTNGNTGEMTFNLVDPATVTGGRITDQTASKSLELKIETDPSAKTVTANVNATCTDGVTGVFTLTTDLPIVHSPGDRIPITVRSY